MSSEIAIRICQVLENGPMRLADVAKGVKDFSWKVSPHLQKLKKQGVVELINSSPRVPGQWRLRK